MIWLESLSNKSYLIQMLSYSRKEARLGSRETFTVKRPDRSATKLCSKQMGSQSCKKRHLACMCEKLKTSTIAGPWRPNLSLLL